MIVRYFIIIVANHILWTCAAIQNGSQVIEKVNKLLVCPADDSKVWLLKICHKWLCYTDHAFQSFFDGTLLITLHLLKMELKLVKSLQRA